MPAFCHSCPNFSWTTADLSGGALAGSLGSISSRRYSTRPGQTLVGTVMVCGLKVALGRAHQHQTVTIHVSDTTLAIEVQEQTRVVRRTTTLPVRNIKADRPRTVPSVS